MSTGTLSILLVAAIVALWTKTGDALPSLLRRWRTDPNQPKTYRVRTLNVMPHEQTPFTQGLEFRQDGSQLIETSGSYPEGTLSYVRGVDPKTGKTLWTSRDGLVDDAFIEGIVQVGGPEGHWFASIYKEPRQTLEYDANLNFLRQHRNPNPFDGWGLTHTQDHTHLLATNGSSYVMTLEPGTFKLLGAKPARCLGRRIPALNELEMVDDFMGQGPTLLGNVYTSRVILALNPTTMRCTGVFDLSGLSEPILEPGGESYGFHVANGIAYNKRTGTLTVTGKNWDKMFEIRLEEDAHDTDNAVHKLTRWLGQRHPAPGIGGGVE